MKKSKPTLYRQGDVLLERVDSIPDEATKAPRCVLALGEATGHCHQVLEGAAMFLAADGVKYLEVFEEQAKVVHEEHGDVVLPRGVYRVGIQREYVAKDLNRAVLD